MNIEQEIINSGFIYDRTPDQPLVLPFSPEELLIQANDNVTADVINLKLKNIHDNFLYLYTRCKITSNLIPLSTTGILGLSSSTNQNFSWTKELTSNNFFTFNTSNPLSGLVTCFNNAKLIYTIPNNELPQYIMFLSNGNYLAAIYSKNEEEGLTIAPVVFSAFNPNFENSDVFYDIECITSGPRNTFLILDKGINKLYQYIAKGITENDNIYNNNPYLLLQLDSYIGELGSSNDKLGFNSPTDVITYNNNVYVLDTGNKCIKKYDEYLNWQYTYILEKDFLFEKPLKLKVDNEGNFFCLLSGNKYFIYNNNFQTKQEIIIDFFNNSEQAIDFFFSPTDTNVFYIITNQNVYKSLRSNLDYPVGRYLMYYMNYADPQLIKSFCAHKNGKNDKTFILSVNSTNSATIVGAFADNINLYDSLIQPSFDIYSFDEIKLNPDEYVQSWVLNKSINKIIANHIRLMDQLIGKFTFKYDYRGNAVFNFTKYLTQEEKTSIQNIGGVI